MATYMTSLQANSARLVGRNHDVAEANQGMKIVLFNSEETTIRKLEAVIVCLVLSCFSFSGCGGGDNSPPPPMSSGGPPSASGVASLTGTATPSGAIDNASVTRKDASGTFSQARADANGQDTRAVPFATFLAKPEINVGESRFEAKALFSLGARSNGVSPLTEAVSFRLGTFSATLPAGSFEQDQKGRFRFEDDLNDVALEVTIIPHGDTNFEFKIEGQGANLAGTVNPVSVGLTIGDDRGSATLTADLGTEQ